MKLFVWIAALLATGISVAFAQDGPTIWERLARHDNGKLVLSIKYVDAAARSRLIEKAAGYADLPFINRVVMRIERDDALSFEEDSGIRDVEVLGRRTADRTFHKLLELYRVYLYQVSGRFGITVVNFSQGVPYFDRNSEERGDRTIAEAIEVLSSRVAPVLVAIGDGPEFGVGGWALAPSALPVVATTADGKEILANSARPEAGKSPWRTVLYADGEPTGGRTDAEAGPACGEGAHLTADQMLHPESALVPNPGGSSYATFKATWNMCFIQQYLEVIRVQMRARTPVGKVKVEPFLAYYVDSPVNKSCTTTKYRWADQRYQAEPPEYMITAADKARLDHFVAGNSVELRAVYSIPLLKAFLNHLPALPMTGAVPNERYVTSDRVLAMLRDFRLRDLVEVAANRNNVRFADWKRKAEADTAPVIASSLMDAIEQYCRNATLFLVLSDEEKPFFDLMP